MGRDVGNLSVSLAGFAAGPNDGPGDPPSFRYADEDRVTFRPYPEDRAQLAFHQSAKIKRNGKDIVFDDGSGLLKRVARDAEARRPSLSW